MFSAFAFSSAECTLPYRVTWPATVSTLIAVPLTPSVVNRDSLILVVIQASGVAAPAGAASAAPSTTAMTLYLIHIHDSRCMILLLDRRTLTASFCHPSPARSPGLPARWSAVLFHLRHSSRAISRGHRCERMWTIDLALLRKMWLCASLCVHVIRFRRWDAG